MKTELSSSSFLVTGVTLILLWTFCCCCCDGCSECCTSRARLEPWLPASGAILANHRLNLSYGILAINQNNFGYNHEIPMVLVISVRLEQWQTKPNGHSQVLAELYQSASSILVVIVGFIVVGHFKYKNIGHI